VVAVAVTAVVDMVGADMVVGADFMVEVAAVSAAEEEDTAAAVTEAHTAAGVMAVDIVAEWEVCLAEWRAGASEAAAPEWPIAPISCLETLARRAPGIVDPTSRLAISRE
jgi:hypothetical protein